MSKYQHYINGEWLRAEDAKISIFDLAVSRGIAVFETMRSYDGRLPKLQQHIDRLNNSAKEVGINHSVDEGETKSILEEGLERNRGGNFTIKLTLTAGINEGLLSSNNPTLIVSFFDLTVPSKEQYEKGIKLATYKEQRYPAHIKSTNYIVAKRGLMHAKETDADDALYIDENGLIYETTISNIFFIKEKKLITPKDNILRGITRNSIIEIATKQGIEVEERDVNISELKDFTEVFATGSVKEVLAINSIDDANYLAPGEVTKQLAVAYKESLLL